MKVLGIDSSCDDTAAAVVEDGRAILSSVVASQVAVHAPFGGVVPELACRSHVQAIVPVVDAALGKAGCGLEAIDVIAVTHRPGLIGALLVGLSAAKVLALALEKILVGVDHIAAHIYSCQWADPPPPYPHLALIVSGGHTSLYRAQTPIEAELLGATTDDAAGEAFDKVSAILGLGYPGGPAIDRAAARGDPAAIPFPRTLLGPESLDFSFSGIKTAVLYHVRGKNARSGPWEKVEAPPNVADVAASFQEAVVDMLVQKTLRAAEREGLRAIGVGGGVAANRRLREKLEAAAKLQGRTIHFPPIALCTDNAAMVAGLGHHLALAGRMAGLDLDAFARTEAEAAIRGQAVDDR